VNKVVFITGSAVGIGRGVATSWAKESATIVALDIDAAENKVTHSQVEAAGGTCHSYTCDISDRDAVRAVFDDLNGKIDHIDLLVNNAAVYGDTKLTSADWDTQTRAFDTAMGSCANGAFYCTAAAVPLLEKSGTSNIINMLTDHVRPGFYLTGGPATGYDCAKFALWRLTESWAEELKEMGVRVNGLCFGATDTPMLREFAPQAVENGMKVEDLDLAIRHVINQGPDGDTGVSYDFGMGPTPRATSLEQIDAIRK
jgi:NAD(P)-dependent dehydrogenase (short-subunit alcohol dehydrogenase family)